MQIVPILFQEIFNVALSCDENYKIKYVARKI